MRSRTFTWADPEALAAAARDGRTGLAFLQAIAAGELPAPPIGRMLGMDILEVAEGRAVFSLEPTEWMFNPIGSVHGGIAATVLDSCMGCAVQTTLPAGTGYTTSDLQCWPASDSQHCAIHRVRKLPERERERVRRTYWQALDEATHERDAKQRLEALVDELEAAGYTAAARCLADDLNALVVHLRYPTRHRRRWRSTNLLERSLGEVKRRTKVIGRFPGETSCLTLV